MSLAPLSTLVLTALALAVFTQASAAQTVKRKAEPARPVARAVPEQDQSFLYLKPRPTTGAQPQGYVSIGQGPSASPISSLSLGQQGRTDWFAR